MVQGQIAIQADAERIIQDGRSRDSGLRGGLRPCGGLRGEALKEQQSEQEGRERMFWHNVLFVLSVNYINNVHLMR